MSISKSARKPAIELVSVVNMPEIEWHEWRKKGLGGSDVAALMGLSPFQTARDLYNTKVGIKPAINEESNWVAKEVGNRLEGLVAEIFTSKTGLKHYPKGAMYSHPDYPFMLANLDFVVKLPDGRNAILECKTTNYNCKDKWADDVVPINYELQVRHYMAVMDIDIAYIACLYGNNENEFIYRRIDRDMDYEADLIEQESQFWNENVLAKVEPPYTESGDLVLASIRRTYGLANENMPQVELDLSFAADIEKYLALKAEKSELEKQSKAIENNAKKAIASVLEKLGPAYDAICRVGDENFFISHKPVFRTEVDLDGIKAQHPDVYAQFVEKPESYRKLTIKKRTVKK